MARKTKRPFAAGADLTDVNCEAAGRVSQDAGSDPKLPPGTNRCLCSECGRYFGGADGFTRHRVNYQCVDPATVGLQLNSRGYWIRKGPKPNFVSGGKRVIDDFATTRLDGEGRP
jgi:hypothetical protein